MLVLTVRPNDCVLAIGSAYVRINKLTRTGPRLGIDAPRHVPVQRLKPDEADALIAARDAVGSMSDSPTGLLMDVRDAFTDASAALADDHGALSDLVSLVQLYVEAELRTEPDSLSRKRFASQLARRFTTLSKGSPE